MSERVSEEERSILRKWREKGSTKINGFKLAKGLFYSKDWIWIKNERNSVRIGITDYAQKQMQEVEVLAGLPSEGDEVMKGEPFGTVESATALTDLVAPISGKVIKVNGKAENTPKILNEDPYGEGWILVVSPSNLYEDMKTLMSFEQASEWYKEII